MKTCGAKTRIGGRCKKPPMENGRCRLHGGATPSGLASPQYKHGRWSKAMPARLLERYQMSADDPDLLALRHEIALLDARLEDLLKRVDTGESGAIWKLLRDTFTELQTAKTKGDLTLEAIQFATLSELITRGTNDSMAWVDVLSIVEQRRKLVESEQKRLVAGKMMLQADEALAFVGALTEAIKKHVTDRNTLSAIGNEFARLIGRADRRPVESELNAGG